MYKLIKVMDGTTYPFKIDGNLHIPMDEANTDYQAYLKWLDEGNTPEPADENK